MILKLCLKANNIKKKVKILSFVKKKLKKSIDFLKFWRYHDYVVNRLQCITKQIGD